MALPVIGEDAVDHLRRGRDHCRGRRAHLGHGNVTPPDCVLARLMQETRDSSDSGRTGRDGVALCSLRCPSREPVTSCERTDGPMTSLLQASLTAAVTLALYAFYCYWEAGRADLAAS